MNEHQYARDTPKTERDRHYCCVPLCANVKTTELHLHQVPKDSAVRLKWASAVKTEKTLTVKMKVCSKHFLKEDYIISRGEGLKPRLKPYVVPSLHLPIHTHVKVISSPLKCKKVAKSDKTKKQTPWTDPSTLEAAKLVWFWWFGVDFNLNECPRYKYAVM